MGAGSRRAWLTWKVGVMTRPSASARWRSPGPKVSFCRCASTGPQGEEGAERVGREVAQLRLAAAV